MPTVADVIAQARFRTDQDAGFTQVEDADLLAPVNRLYQRLHAMLVRANPDAFQRSATFTLAGSTDSIDLAAATATDFWQLTELEYQFGSTYRKLDRFNWKERDSLQPSLSLGRGYHVKGSTVYIRPSERAAGNYRVWYIPQAANLLSTATSLDPLTAVNGAEEWIVEQLCALIRVRLDDDPTPHLDRAKVLEQHIVSMAQRDVSEPETVADVWDADWNSPWRW